MEARQVVTFEFPVFGDTPDFENTTEYFAAYLGSKTNVYGRIMLTLIQYLLQYSETFDAASVVISLHDKGFFLWNRSRTEKIRGYVDVSDVHINPQAFTAEEWDGREGWGLAYPYGLCDYTFMTRKQKYKPHVFGIFGAFSSSLWTATFSVFVVTSLVYYATTRHSIHEILINGLAVLLRKNSTLRPSSVPEHLLLWSWVVGTMFLCLAYDSVFLSFLTVPPLTEIKNVRQLTALVKKGDYHCVVMPSSYDTIMVNFLTEDKQENVVIGFDLLRNHRRHADLFRDFFEGKSSSSGGHVAFVSDTETIDMYSTREMSSSEDSFLQTTAAMIFRKSFCCRELLDAFVHRLMSSGLYFKYRSDERHFFRLSYLLKGTETDDSHRKITLTDVGAAFLFLLAGYFLAALVLVGEIWQHRRKRTRKQKRKRMTDEYAV